MEYHTNININHMITNKNIRSNIVPFSEDDKAIAIGKGKDKITFYIPKHFRNSKILKKHLNNPQRLQTAYNLIIKLNKFLSDNIVKTFHLKTLYGHYDDKNNIIDIDYANPHHLHTIAHEFGHALFFFRLSGKIVDNHVAIKDVYWQKLYALSLGDNNFEIIDDSNYVDTAEEKYGHPHHNANEFFASSFAVYYMSSDKLINNINNNASPSRQLTGKLIFSYMKDNVFDGKTFSTNTSLNKLKWDEMKHLITDEAVNKSLINALKSNDGKICDAAIAAIRDLNLSDNIFIPPLLITLKNDDTQISTERTIISMKNKKFIPHLIELLNSKDESLNCSAARIICGMKIKDKRYLKPLLNSLINYSGINTHIIIDAIISQDDKQFIDPIIKILHNKDTRTHVRERIFMLLKKWNRNDEPIMQALLKICNDENEYNNIRNEAEKTLEAIKNNNPKE